MPMGRTRAAPRQRLDDAPILRYHFDDAERSRWPRIVAQRQPRRRLMTKWAAEFYFSRRVADEKDRSQAQFLSLFQQVSFKVAK